MAQSPGDRRRERNDDGNPYGEQCLVAEEHESSEPPLDATSSIVLLWGCICHELYI
jgi:hypothetical protein